MASPQLQMAIDAMKSLMKTPPPTLAEMRAAFERNAMPAQPDLSSERVDANGVDAEWVAAPGAVDRVVMYLHGGGYILGSVSTHRDLIGRLSRAAQARVLALNYRLAPEYPFPAAVDDAVAGYRWLLDRKISPARIALAGDSAGGGLTIAALVAIRDAGLPLPAAGVCLSPWVDMEMKGESMTTRAHADPVVQRQGLIGMAQAYLSGKDPRTALASPLYADLTGLPPMLIQVGDAETLLDDSVRIADKARAAKVQIKLEVWPEMIHVWQLFAAFLPEGQQAIDGIGQFLRERIAS
jgi:monoterpene epsilon-lactone hydrolase